MTDDFALDALESTKEQLGIEIPTPLLKRILEIEQRYAFDRDETSSALKEIESAVDEVLREGVKP
jgi:hypothetical protein